jgi:dolichol-phosphate mannosyltransferase
MTNVWVVVPTYNEAENIDDLILAVVNAAARVPASSPHLLIVDDNSPDGTGRRADALAQDDARVHVLHRQKKEGLGRAYIAGFSHALANGADIVVEMDADFSHDPADIPRLVLALMEGSDLVIGSRYVPGGAVENWRPQRRVVSRAGCWYARRVLGVSIRDLTGGFKAFRASALRTIDYTTVRSRGYAFQVEMTWRTARADFRIREVPIRFCERREGDSKMSAAIALEAAWRIPALRLRPAERRLTAEAAFRTVSAGSPTAPGERLSM